MVLAESISPPLTIDPFTEIAPIPPPAVVISPPARIEPPILIGPMELLLAALGSCTATDVVAILAKKRQKLERLEIVITGERANEIPAVWTKLDLVYRLYGSLDEKAVRDTIELSETKYCSVAAMLRKTALISFRYEILPAKA